MAQKVSILDGEVNRNWQLVDSAGEKHLLALYHDCVTGARAAMLDYEEVPGSAGTTNLFNLVAGQVDIPFSMKKGSVAAKDSGRLSILRRGLTGFSYECEVNGKLMLDTTSIVQNTDYEYEVAVPATVDTGSRVSGVTWYEVHTMRKADSKGTLVHRRFRDFCALHDQVESLMKGHHLRSSLPRFPGKKSKLWTNHGDMSFVENRRQALEQYLKTLLQLPHVSTLDSTRAFLGMVGNLREFSVAWEGKELGVTLKRASEVAGGMLGVGAGAAAGPNGDGGAPPVIVAVVGKERSPPGVLPGDRLLKVNGESTELMSLEAAWSSVARAARPVMLHFLGPILRMDSTLAPLPEAFLRHRDTPGQHSAAPGAPGNTEPPLIGGLPRSNASGGSTSASADPHAGSDGGQWSLRGMLPGWRREQASSPAGNGALGSASTPAKPVGAGRGWHPHQKPPGAGSTAGRGLSAGAVGPFGNGAGAAGTGRTLPSNSRLFGGDATGVGGGSTERDGTSLYDSWRSPAAPGAVGAGGAMYPAAGRGYGGRKLGAGSSKGSSDWMPSMSRGTGALANSASPPALWKGTEEARPLPQESTSSGDTARSHSAKASEANQTTEPFPRGASADFPESGSERYGKSSGSFLGAMPAWPPEQTNEPVAARGGLSARAAVDEGGGNAGRAYANPAFSDFERGAGSTAAGTQSAGAGLFGAPRVLETGGDRVDSEEEEEGEDDENPFA